MEWLRWRRELQYLPWNQRGCRNLGCNGSDHHQLYATLRPPAVNETLFNCPLGAAVDSGGNIFVADCNNCTIRKMTPTGVVSTLAGNPGVSGTANGVGSAAQFEWPQGVAVDSSGNVYVADTGNSTVRKITPAGAVTTLAGCPNVTGTANGTGSVARFNQLYGVAVDACGFV